MKIGSIRAIDGQPCDVPTIDGGAPSDADELSCTLDDGTCACTTGPDAAHAHARTWVCTVPRAPCPTERPLVGQPCSSGALCDYGTCEFKRGMRMQCSAGVWINGGATCD